MNRMHTCSRFVASVAAIAVMLVSSPVVRADAYDGSPKPPCGCSSCTRLRSYARELWPTRRWAVVNSIAIQTG